MNNRLYNILALSTAFGPGSHKAVTIYKSLCDIEFFDKPFDELLSADCFDEKSKERLNKVNSADIAKIIKSCADNEIDILPIFSSKYPETLKNIYSPPLVLYVRGELPDIKNDPVFCIVGPRRATEFGRKAAYSLARRIARAGMIVVGGSADGCDTSAHKGAISVNGKSIMVIADGILTHLKSRNGQLLKSVLKNGCIISESAPYLSASKYSFPIRNRLMSALSLGVAVIEAPEKSGALLTANHALEQGKDVYAVPGNPTDKSYKGSNALLRDGAIPLLDASDIFLRYIGDYPDKIDIEKAYATDKRKTEKENSQKKSFDGLSKEALLVYNNLIKPEFTVDDLSGLEIDTAGLLSSLTELEMEHLITALPGGAYKIKDKREF